MVRAGVAQACRILLVAAGVTGLILGWGPPGDMLAPLVFFSDQSNIIVAAYFTFAVLWPAVTAARPPLADGVAGRRLSAARESFPLRGAVTLYILITGLVYHFVLATNTNPLHLLTSPVDRTADLGTFLLHYTVPVLALADFLLFERGGQCRWRHAAAWLCYPLAYLAYALLRGAFFTVGSYPYPFLDVTKHGYPGVMLNVVEYAVFFYLLGIGVVALGRLVRARGAAAATAAPAPAARRA